MTQVLLHACLLSITPPITAHFISKCPVCFHVLWYLIPCSLASLWCNLLAVVGDHHVRLPVVIAVLSCNLDCFLLYVWHQYSIAWRVFMNLCFPCGFVWRASLWWTDLVQVCIWLWLCIGVCWEKFVVFSVTALQHHSWRLLLVVCDLLLYSSLVQSSNDGISRVHVVYLVPLFQRCCIFFPHLTGFCWQMW